MNAVSHHAPVAAEESERPALLRIDDLFARQVSPDLQLSGPDGEEVALPASLARALRHLVGHLARGQAVTLVPLDRELTSQQAADLLNVSRPYLVRLLERGDIPFTRVGRHRRVRLDDVLVYRERRDTERLDALKDLTRLSQELGLYDS